VSGPDVNTTGIPTPYTGTKSATGYYYPITFGFRF